MEVGRVIIFKYVKPWIKSGDITTWSDKTQYGMQHSNENITVTKDIPYLTLTSELWDAYCE